MECPFSVIHCHLTFKEQIKLRQRQEYACLIQTLDAIDTFRNSYTHMFILNHCLLFKMERHTLFTRSHFPYYTICVKKLHREILIKNLTPNGQ